MSDRKPSQILGKFYTVDDLMNLPERGAVDPRKAMEVSRDVPLRFWFETDALLDLLREGMEMIKANREQLAPEERRHADVLLASRQLWIDHLEAVNEQDTFVGLFPASQAGDEWDHESAVHAPRAPKAKRKRK